MVLYFRKLQCAMQFSKYASMRLTDQCVWVSQGLDRRTGLGFRNRGLGKNYVDPLVPDCSDGFWVGSLVGDQALYPRPVTNAEAGIGRQLGMVGHNGDAAGGIN